MRPVTLWPSGLKLGKWSIPAMRIDGPFLRRWVLGRRIWLVTGEIQKEGIVVHLVAKRIDALDGLAGEISVPSRDFH